jgi:hypothetical protein
VDICFRVGSPVLTSRDVGKYIRDGSCGVSCVYVAEWDGVWVGSQKGDIGEIVPIWVGACRSGTVGRIDYELEFELWICCKGCVEGIPGTRNW